MGVENNALGKPQWQNNGARSLTVKTTGRFRSVHTYQAKDYQESSKNLEEPHGLYKQRTNTIST